MALSKEAKNAAADLYSVPKRTGKTVASIPYMRGGFELNIGPRQRVFLWMLHDSLVNALK